ncbi:MAG TPA: hypothetical protein VN030_07470 [Cellvibrio sp.]|nr:hypothetical protein [Cellvibrio sp.]
MNSLQIREKLLAEGCNESNFSVGRRVSDSYCLDVKGGEWVVFYTERGQDSEPIFSSVSEEKACQFFYDYVMRMQHWHILGFFEDEAAAISLESKLISIGVQPVRNDIPAYQGAGDPRYRVFVVGKDIFKVRKLLSDVSTTPSGK